MKFLCVPCDSPMKLQTVGPPERGSLSVVYSCPECGYEIAMLTNAYETQVVQSLGVRIGPSTGLGAGPSTGLGAGPSTGLGAGPSTGLGAGPSTGLGAGPSTGLGAGPEAAAGSASKCPFTAMISSTPDERSGDPALANEHERVSHANGAGPGAPASERAGGSGGAKPPGLGWTAAAEARLANIPEFVRPMARTGIEKFAQERGALEVDERILDEARDFFGM